MKKISILLLIFVVLSFSALAQSEAQPKQKVIVETKGGDKVTGLFISADSQSVVVEVSGAKITLNLADVAILRFDEKASAENTQPSPNATKLSFEAAIVYRMGGAQPVARTNFVLLDKSLDDILRESGITVDRGLTYASAYGFAVRFPDTKDAKKYLPTIQQLISQHTVSSTTSDFSGKGQFIDIKPGSYWILAVSQTRGGFAVWNLPVTVKEGENTVTLDQNNAATAF